MSPGVLKQTRKHGLHLHMQTAKTEASQLSVNQVLERQGLTITRVVNSKNYNFCFHLKPAITGD